MSDLSQTGLALELGRHTRSIEQDNWQVGAGATTTVIPVTLANPSGVGVGLTVGVQQRIQGTVCEFISGQNQGQSAAVSNCAANGTLTLDAALPFAPASGDRFILLRSVNVTVEAAENVAQWAGTNVAAPQGDNVDGVADQASGIPVFLSRLTGWTGAAWSRLKLAATGSLQTRDDATGATAAAIPAAAVMVGGSDGADLRALATDATGVAKTMGGYNEAAIGSPSPSHAVQISNFPTSFAGIAATGAPIAADGELATSFTAPGNGTVVLSVTLASGAASSVLQVSRNASAATPFWANLNSGTALAAENEFDANIPVAIGDVVNFRLVTATTLGWAEFFFIAEQ